MLFSRRTFASGAAALTSSLLLPTPAHATSAIALSMNEMVARSDRAVLGTPVHFESEWAYVGGGRRIVTFTRVLQEQDMMSEGEESDEVIVMTLGGKVGKLRQKVQGEAALQVGTRALIFVSAENSLSRRVIGMAQGHFPTGQRGDPDVLSKSSLLPHLFGVHRDSANAAVNALDGQHIRRARQLVRSAR